MLGIASVARPPGVEYLTKSLHRVIESLDKEELAETGTYILVKILVQNFATKKQFPKSQLFYSYSNPSGALC